MQQLIEHILTELKIEYDCKDDYIHCHSPFSKDSIKSCQVFYDNGFMKIYNGNVNGKNCLSLKEWTFLLGFNSEYVEYMLSLHSVPIYKYNRYKTLLQDNISGINISYKELNELKKLFSFLYMSQNDVLSIPNTKPTSSTKYNKKSKRKKSKIEEVICNEKENKDVINYMKKRIVPVTKISYPATLNINDVFRVPTICFEYPNGFKKYRILEGNLRYLSLGDYKTLYEFRNEKTPTLIVCEGEIECVSLSEVIDCDLFALHNVNSVAIQNDLSSYKRIIIFLDNDKYEEVKDKIYQDFRIKFNFEILVLPKFESKDKSLDFNSYLLNNGTEEFKKYLKKHLTNYNIHDTL